MANIITPDNIHRIAIATLPEKDIDHYASDLYIRVTPESKKIIAAFEYAHMVEVFRDNIDGVLWYDLPFCYDPTITTV